MEPLKLHSDFNCPFCYALHERLHALQVMAKIEWQGVQHAPHLPVPMMAWVGHAGSELKQEVEMVRRLAPEVPIIVPKGKPNTTRAVVAAARALQIDRHRGSLLVRALYRLFWCDGQDLSDDDVLRNEAGRHGFSADEIMGPEAPSVDRLLRAWSDQWEETEHHGVPILQRADGRILVGLASMETLQNFFSDR
ncbi:MAG: DsbA family protein [Nitrospira sp.]|nr:DsbA family protein [Nitrospira sp.]